MPIDPRYKFTNSQADLAGNGGRAFRAGMGLWGGPQPEPVQRATPYIPSEITPDVIQAARMGRQQPQPQQPIAPVAPMAPRQPMQAPQMPMIEQDLPPEMPQPEQQTLGYGNIEDIPTNEDLDNTPQSDKHTELQNQEIERLKQTKLAQQGVAMGIDPRQLYVALAQFSAGMGNIKGQDTKSTAADFYNMQKTYEGQDEARRMRQEEFAARMAPKPVDPLDVQQKQAMIEYLKRKGMPQPAAPLDPMKQKLAEAQIANLEARTKNEKLGSERPVKTDGQQMLSPKQIKSSTELRKEYQNHHVTKTSNELNAMWGKVKEVMDNPSAAGDMASIFMFMKALDPSSTVREGEYKSAAEATSALGRVEQFLQKAGSGKNLTDTQRADFRQIMEKFYRAQLKSQKRVDDQYKGLAGRIGVDPQDLLINDAAQKSTIKSVNDLPDVR